MSHYDMNIQKPLLKYVIRCSSIASRIYFITVKNLLLRKQDCFIILLRILSFDITCKFYTCMLILVNFSLYDNFVLILNFDMYYCLLFNNFHFKAHFIFVVTKSTFGYEVFICTVSR